MECRPDAAHVEAVRGRMMSLVCTSGKHRMWHRTAWIAGCAVVGLTTVGLGGTQAGRDWVRSLFTPVEEIYMTTWAPPDGAASYSQVRNSMPYSEEEEAAVACEFREIHVLQQAGGGRLVGLLESPGGTTYQIEYTLRNGEAAVIGCNAVTPALGTRQEREAIFAEARQLKQGLRFTVLQAHADRERPRSPVWGVLQYTLADGRTIGISEPVPAELISVDGTRVLMPGVEEGLTIEQMGGPPH